MPAKRIPVPARIDAVRRVRLGGEVAKRVAESIGVTVRQIYRWEQDTEVREALGLDERPPPPPPRVDSPLVDDLEIKRLLDAVRDGLAPGRAMRLIGRHPGAWRLWQESAARGDQEARRVVEAVTRADAEMERACVLAVRKGGMGWQGPAWLLERRMPEVYSQAAATEAQAADTYSPAELLEVVRASGLLEGVL